MDRWLISPVSLEIESQTIKIDPTIQAERREILKRLADGTESVSGIEYNYSLFLVEPRELGGKVNVSIIHKGQCIESGEFTVINEQNHIIRLTKIKPID